LEAEGGVGLAIAIYPKLGNGLQRSATHPPVLEEVEGYKNIFVFAQVSRFKFSRGGRVET
jgi:hypothetical protein